MLETVREEHDSRLEYWHARGLRPVRAAAILSELARAADDPAPYRPEVERRRMPEEATRLLDELCGGAELSTFVVLAAFLKGLLHRYRPDDRSSLIAPLPVPAADGLVLLQDEVRGTDTVRQLIEETRRTVLGAFANGGLTLSGLLGEAQAQETLANAPVCLLAGLHGDAALPPRAPIVFRFSREEEAIVCETIYDANRLRPDLVVALARNVETFVLEACRDLERPLDAVPLGGPAPHAAAGPSTPIPACGLEALVREQASRTPSATALVLDDGALTYDALDRLTARTAAGLRARGVRPGDRVAVVLEPGPTTAVVLLAVARAGASFVPIGAGEPPARLARLIERVGPAVVVAEEGTPLERIPVARVSPAELTKAETVDAPPTGRVVGDDAEACVLFTSGSSGEPKGVVVRHRGLVNAVDWKRRRYGFAPGHVVLSLFDHVFDGYVLNLLAPLAGGAAVVAPTREMLHRPEAAAAAIARHRVTHLTAAPFLVGALLETAERDALGALARVTVAGEAASRGMLERLRAARPGIEVCNEYGTTEASVVSTFNPDLRAEAPDVVGRPIDNTVVAIHDAGGRPAPTGVTGEILIGGAGCAHDRLDSPDADEVATMPDGERMYRTRDLGRRLPSGEIEFRGRAARYVKLRGRRIDLEEIRRCLLARPGIDEAIAFVAGGADDGFVAACVATRARTTAHEVASALRDALPEPLVPQHVEVLDAFPRTPGGKLDAQRLRARVEANAAGGLDDPPATETERRLAALWSRILAVPGVGANRNFFALGGHSLKAVKLLSDVYETFGVDVPLRAFFKANTVRALGALVDREAHPAGRAGEAPPPPTIHPVSGAQNRILALLHDPGAAAAYTIPVVYELEGRLDPERLEAALRVLVARHPVLRTCFRLVDGRWTQQVEAACPVRVETRTVATDADLDAQLHAAVAPFDPSTAPLLRATLLETGSGGGLLVLACHHLLVDEASLALLLGELADLYDGRALPPPPSRGPADLAREEVEERASDAYRAAMDAWARKLAFVREEEPLALPYDRHRPRRRSWAGDVVRSRLAVETGRAIDALCRRAGTSRFAFHLAAFGLLLGRYAQRSRVVVGAPVSMRDTHALRGVPGLFLNTLPFATEIDDEASFLDHLRRVGASVAEDLANGLVHLDDIVSAVRPPRVHGQSPLFEVVLSLADTGAAGLELDGVRARQRPIHTGTAKFELVLEVDVAAPETALTLEFSTERFERSTARRLLANYETLLASILAAPEAPLRALSFVSPEETRLLLAFGRVDEERVFPRGTIAARFTEVARTHPGATALVWGERSMTYGALEARARRLARRLRDLDDLGEVVCVLCARGFDAIVAILAIQMAGAAHLPLDPAYPPGQTQRMLDASGARTLLTDQDDLSKLVFAGRVVRVADDDLPESPADAPLASGQTDESLAYVLFTSGTTGDPNGALVEQRNLLGMVDRVAARFGIGPGSVITQFHSMCFDVSVWEMFGALLNGATLVIVPRDAVADPPRLLRLIRDNGVTMLCQPPSGFYLLAEEMLRTGAETSLRHVVLGGEAIKIENLREWSMRYADAR